MRLHMIPPWTPPVPFEPAKKLVKPRKFFHAQETGEGGESSAYPAPPPSDGDEEEHTDILA